MPTDVSRMVHRGLLLALVLLVVEACGSAQPGFRSFHAERAALSKRV
jgi:hypothetical protein